APLTTPAESYRLSRVSGALNCNSSGRYRSNGGATAPRRATWKGRLPTGAWHASLLRAGGENPRDASCEPGDDMGWTFDPHHTIVGFSAKHLGITTVRGIFKEFNVDVQLDDDGNPTTAAGRVVVKAASLDTANEQRDGHLRSADFFDVENYPDIVFVAKS